MTALPTGQYAWRNTLNAKVRIGQMHIQTTEKEHHRCLKFSPTAHF